MCMHAIGANEGNVIGWALGIGHAGILADKAYRTRYSPNCTSKRLFLWPKRQMAGPQSLFFPPRRSGIIHILMGHVDRPYFDVPLICEDCIKAHGAAPYTTTYPKSVIYEFRYEPSGKTWRVLFCCSKKEETFMQSYDRTELIKIVWRQADADQSNTD